MAGWRVGMLCGNSEKIQAVLKVKSNMDSGMFYGIQQGAIAALNQSSEWFAGLDKIYRKRRLLVEQLAKKLALEIAPNQAGMFVWAKLPTATMNATDFTDELLKNHHLFIAPGTIFGSQGEGYVRFSLCIKEEQIQTAIKRIGS